MKLKDLDQPDTFYYIACPYSKDPDGLDVAFAKACAALAKFLDAGIHAFSPIAHTHPCTAMIKADPRDHGFWMRADAPFMRAASGLVVVTLPGWLQSRGVSEEIEFFEAAGKPVMFVDPVTWEITK